MACNNFGINSARLQFVIGFATVLVLAGCATRKANQIGATPELCPREQDYAAVLVGSTNVESDPELKRLTTALNAAESQTDMNIASEKIAEFWDAKLASIEKQISQKLDEEEMKQFSASMSLWQSYRTQEVQFQSGLYEGGSIQPFVANETYSEITEHKVEELENLWTDTIQLRAN